jgi:hypothetical protein
LGLFVHGSIFGEGPRNNSPIKVWGYLELSLSLV